MPDKLELHGSFTLTNSEPQFCRRGKAKVRALGNTKYPQKNVRRKASVGFCVGQFEVLDAVLAFFLKSAVLLVAVAFFV